jgi:hypothetical protein
MRMPDALRLTTASLIAAALSAAPSFTQVARAPAAPMMQGVEEVAAPTVAAPARPRQAVNPLYPKILAMLEAERVELAKLDARLKTTRDDAAAMAIQREIEQLKTTTELGILRLQAEHARALGRAAVAEKLDAAIQRMLQPVPRQRPVDRPAPSVTTTPTR